MNETNEMIAVTNLPPANIPEVPDTLEPLLRALPDWVAQVVVWIIAVNLVLTPFSVWISHKLADMMNSAAASSDEDDDVFLRKLFSAPGYRATAFVFRFINVRLPTLAVLERAIRFQREAVEEWQKSDSNPEKSA